jgi:glycosyltransferase involved in cell wall biosynthesis
MTRKNILIVSPFFPYPPDMGNKNYLYNLIKVLYIKHKVTLLTFIDEKKDKEINHLAQFCDVITVPRPNKKSLINRIIYKAYFIFNLFLKGMPEEVYYSSLPQLGRKAGELLKDRKFDILLVQYWYTGLSGDFVNKTKNIFKALDTHDVQQERFNQIINNSFIGRKQKKYIKKMEIRSTISYDLLISRTEKDKAFFERFYNGLIINIPNGFSAPKVSKVIKNKNLVFFGGMSSKVNISAVLNFAKTVYPLIKKEEPDVTFTILGSDPPEEIIKLQHDPSIKVTGYVDNPEKYFKEASVAVLPLYIEYGLRVRALEIASYGVPIVATSKSVAGMGFSNNKNILIADSDREFADRVISLLKDYKFATSIGKEAQDLIKKNYSIEATYGKLSDYYASI